MTGEKNENCIVPVRWTYTFTDAEGNVLCSYESSGGTTSHDYETKYELNGTSCEDGWTLTQTCKDCGAVSTKTSDYHYMVEKERIDLKSDCGGYATISSCLCGENVSVDFSTNSNCDFGETECDVWIQDALNGHVFKRVDGKRRYESYAYLYRCAVTDPEACGYTIRYAYYWKIENCMAVRYQIWQFGYNEKTDTYDKEVVFKVQEQTQHSYERDENAEGEVYVCKSCGAKLTCTSENNDIGYYEKNVEEVTVEGKTTTVVFERQYEPRCDIEGVKHWNETQWERKETTEADGTVTWEKREYTRGFEDGVCSETEMYTNSEGESRQYTYSGCAGNWVTEKGAGCTQPGQRYWQCELCYTKTNVTQIDPDHTWKKQDDGKFVCEVCGMESETGVSGNVILEDMTEEEGTSYVAGYWVKQGTVSEMNVFLIVGEEEILLSGLEITKLEGPQSVSISKEAIAAKAKENGCTDYLVKLVLTSNNLDYAITFTQKTT